MDFEKIKEWINKHQKILLIGLTIGLIFLYFRPANPGKSNDQLPVQTHESRKQAASTTNANADNESSNQVASNSQSNQQQSKTVTCDISGAIKREGVYSLKSGARLQELIQAAGGLRRNAELKNVNRAQLLKDQDKVHIPYHGEKTSSVITSATDSTSSEETNETSSSESASSETGETAPSGQGSNTAKVNLNTASVADLQKLNGIGEKKAQQIIAYRQQKGHFKKIADLMQVSGIGEKTFAALKNQVTI